MRNLTHDEETHLFDALNNIPALGWWERHAIYRAAQEAPGAWTAVRYIDLGRAQISGQIVTLAKVTTPTEWRHMDCPQIIAALRRAAALTGSDLDRHRAQRNTTETENNA